MLRGLFLSKFFSTMYYIYILFSLKTNRYYVCSTDDLQGRLKHHNAGSTPSTKPGAPDWEIRYTETVPHRATALKRELEIKKKKSRNYLEWLIQKVNVN
jgi:putative endonuclease